MNFARVNVYFPTAIVTYLAVVFFFFFFFFFFIFISLNTNIPLIIQTKFQPNIPSHSGEKVDFNGFVIVSTGGHLGLSTSLTLTGMKPCSLIMLHVKFEIHGCSSFRDKII